MLLWRSARVERDMTIDEGRGSCVCTCDRESGRLDRPGPRTIYQPATNPKNRLVECKSSVYKHTTNSTNLTNYK